MTDDLKAIRSLQHLKATCVSCKTVRHFDRSQVAPIWNRLTQTSEIPATWDMACPTCPEERTTHFLDWPDKGLDRLEDSHATS